MNFAPTQLDLVLPNSGSRSWMCRDRLPASRTVTRRLGHYRRSGSPAERQKILTIWASLTPWSAYFAQRRTQPSRFPRSWMGRVLLTILARI